VKIVLLGLSITSSWGNGHATNYRALVRELDARGHDVLFLERDVPWYAAQRDLASPPWGRTFLYESVDELRERFGDDVRDADLVIVGSYVPEGVAVGSWVTSAAGGTSAFYDIDTPVTLAKLARGDFEYLDPGLVGAFDLYLSFTGGPTLERLEREYGARRAHAFYCLVDPDVYGPVEAGLRWDLGYLGTYSHDRQPQVDALLVMPARAEPRARFVVAGPRYPPGLRWPANVDRLEHVPPTGHRAFYAAQRWTLNVTRADMRAAGWSPSVRLFEAAACGVPVISDRWPGLDELFRDGEEIVIADSPDDVLRVLRAIPDDERRAIGERARAKVLAEHTAARRVDQLEALVVPPCTRMGRRRGAWA
jgi:spore maturation protein CgeB